MSERKEDKAKPLRKRLKERKAIVERIERKQSHFGRERKKADK